MDAAQSAQAGPTFSIFLPPPPSVFRLVFLCSKQCNSEHTDSTKKCTHAPSAYLWAPLEIVEAKSQRQLVLVSCCLNKFSIIIFIEVLLPLVYTFLGRVWIFGSPYPWTLYLQVHQLWIKKYLKKIVSLLKVYRLSSFFLVPKQYSITTTYIVFLLY